MEQRSDVQFRAEKLYKNTKGKFGYLLRETLSNAIHSSIIKLNKDEKNTYQPSIKLIINTSEFYTDVTIKDNGEGFNKLNRECFTRLDYVNYEKKVNQFFPQGQGRLAIIYFTDRAEYTSTYRLSTDELEQVEFLYPMQEDSLFKIEDSIKKVSQNTCEETVLKMFISSTQKQNRAKTFFNKYNTTEKFKYWLIDNFLSFFIEYEKLEIEVEYLSESFTISKPLLANDMTSFSFEINKEDESKEKVNVFIVKTNRNSDNKNNVFCYARHLKAGLSEGKLEYDIDLQEPQYWVLTSRLFDTFADSKGDKIEIGKNEIEKIQEQLNIKLDEYYKEQIKENQKQTRQHIENTVNKFHSLKVFIDDDIAKTSRKIRSQNDIVNMAIEEKGRIEKNYWNDVKTENNDSEKLLNSSLHIYIDHRRRVLEKLHNMILRFDNEGNLNNSPESDIHELFLKRGIELSNNNNVNQLHNLWLFDDKYTVFSETTKALSSKQGQSLSDIYLWIDDPEKVKELLILELKSTTKAHNAGDKIEGMVSQIGRYARDFYNNPEKVLKWHIDTDLILYTGIIIARASDINREINNGGKFQRIPFLQNSYYINSEFSAVADLTAKPNPKDIRIELYSFEDIYELAKARNTVFFKLLNGEIKSLNE